MERLRAKCLLHCEDNWMCHGCVLQRYCSEVQSGCSRQTIHLWQIKSMEMQITWPIILRIENIFWWLRGQMQLIILTFCFALMVETTCLVAQILFVAISRVYPGMIHYQGRTRGGSKLMTARMMLSVLISQQIMLNWFCKVRSEFDVGRPGGESPSNLYHYCMLAQNPSQGCWSRAGFAFPTSNHIVNNHK